MKTITLSPTSQEIEVPAGTHRYHIAVADTESDTQYIFHLRHPQTEISIVALVRAELHSPNVRTQVIHHVGRTKANALVKTLAQGSAKPNFEGVITIAPNAQSSQSYLSHHSLLLGEKAASRSIPSLEIEAHEVQCSHAATVRTITDADLFYLRARGLSRPEAQQILIDAFLHDVQI